jgi:transcriptional regulator with GAF, ATPase, and Fis domain
MVRRTEPPAGEATHSADALCASFVTELGVSGASISVVSYLGRQSTICSSDATVARAEALQFELGEGPHWEALESRAPVLCSDLDATDESRWPLFIDAARGLGIHAIFAFPMLMGAALVGVVDLYSTTARTVDRDFVARASHAASRAAHASVQRALHSAAHHASEETPMAPALRREVHQATGMILSQLEISATAAFARLQGHAFVTGRPIEDIARDVVLGNLVLSNTGDNSPRSEGD